MDVSGASESETRSGRGTLRAFVQWERPVQLMAGSALLLLLFLFLIYPAYPTAVGKSLSGWIWHSCNSKNNFLHGRFVPFAFLVMAWMAWQRCKDEFIKPSFWGLAIFAVGALFFLISVRTIQPRVAIIGAPLVIIGCTYYLFGWKIAKHIIFPSFFLWFTIPVPGLEAALTGRLQTLITKWCYEAGIFVGMDLTREGSNITVADSSVKVAEGCSGIRSLMALTMIAAVYANYTQKALWKKAVLFASSFPLAIIGNFFRIFSILILGQFGFGDFGNKTFHDWSGILLFFPIALSGLYLVDYLLNFKTMRRKRVRKSVKEVTNVDKEMSNI